MFKSTLVSTLALAALLVTSATVHAQNATDVSSDDRSRWQLIVNSGTMIPTGSQRDAIKRGGLTIAQLSYAVRPALAVTGSAGWTRTRDVASPDDPKLDMFTYDIGLEWRANRLVEGRTLSFSPFAGAGAGGRSYNYRSIDLAARHNPAGYAGVGGEIGVGSRVQIRLEARDYVTGFKPLDRQGTSDLRNDLSLMAGLRLRVR